jgi:hypothetical protein
MMVAKNVTTKRALSPRSAKKTGPKGAAKGATKPKKARSGPTKADKLIALLQRPDGASMAELQKALSTQEHSIRAQISIEKRKRGLTVTLSDGRYRIAG